MRRREFMAGLASVATCPLAARAQPSGRVWRIGFLAGGARPARLQGTVYGAFLQGMQALGYVEDKSFVMEWRFADGAYDRFPALAEELVRAKVDVIVLGTVVAVRPTQQVTRTIPIVMANSIDPVGNGLVASLAHPGGNTTGLSGAYEDYIPKLLELVQSIVPHLARIAVLVNPRNDAHWQILKYLEEPGSQARLTIQPIEIGSAQELDGAFSSAKRAGAVMALGDAFFLTWRKRLAELAIENRLPSIFVQREYAVDGGLMSYGENLADFFQRAATFVDKILKGAHPSDLPVEQPTRYTLVVNRRTAEKLGLMIPEAFLLRADEVIE
jgi:putative ABC transport system substrate-binding protein